MARRKLSTWSWLPVLGLALAGAVQADTYSNQSALADKDVAAARAKAQSPSALNNLCWTLATAGVELEAIAAYDAALRVSPTQAMSLYGRGVAKHRKGDSSGGDADIRAAVDLNAHVAKRFADFGLQP